MPTLIGHALTGLAVAAFAPRPTHWPAAILVPWGTLALACLPDADVIGFRLGIPYDHLLGHRGLTHSLAFALTAALAVAVPAFARHGIRTHRSWHFLAVFLCAAVSHPLLDMLTDGGKGIALLAPLENERLFFPVQPIPVSPLRWGPGVIQVALWELVRFGPLCLLLWGGRRLFAFRRRHPSS